MPFVTRKSMLTLTLLAIAGLAIVGGFIWSGIYNVGADDTHTRPVYALLQTMRQRSITSRASAIEVPDLSDPTLIRQGAGNYDSMCTGCHLAPGMEDTELSKGLYPAPPAFAKAAAGDPAHHFWVIKHGIKATGMPAWGKSMENQYIWGMVAFLQQLPKLSMDEYQALVASSGGHLHGGGETESHAHAEGTPDERDAGMDAGETAEDAHEHDDDGHQH
jgi:mono/diheme cytochrome c family protein